MRGLLLLIAAIGLSSIPGAIANSQMAPPATLVAHRDDEGVTLAWSPVPGATRYVILAGDSPAHMVRVAYTSLTAHRLGPLDATFFGVAAMDAAGEASEPRTVPMQQSQRGDCVATSTSLRMSVSLHSCLSLIP